MDKRYFAKLEIKMCVGGISYIAQPTEQLIVFQF